MSLRPWTWGAALLGPRPGGSCSLPASDPPPVAPGTNCRNPCQFVYEGWVDFNREVLEEGNQTITSQVQAIIELREGQWWLMDRSAQHTTFLLVPHSGVPLNPGDKILMGNRVFEFKPDTK